MMHIEEPLSKSRTIRLAAALFLFVCVPMSIWDQVYVPGKIFVPQDPVATANNLLSNELVFRLSIISHLAGFLIFVFMMLLFYRTFRPVDKNLSQLMLIPLLAQIPIIFIFEVLNFSALMFIKTEPTANFDISHQLDAVYFLFRMYKYGIGPGMGKLFNGLCFIPFGMLVLHSRNTPRIIGILIIIGGVGYVADCAISVLLQRADYLVVRSYLKYTTIAYFLAFFWFLVRGLHPQKVHVKN